MKTLWGPLLWCSLAVVIVGSFAVMTFLGREWFTSDKEDSSQTNTNKKDDQDAVQETTKQPPLMSGSDCGYYYWSLQEFYQPFATAGLLLCPYLLQVCWCIGDWRVWPQQGHHYNGMATVEMLSIWRKGLQSTKVASCGVHLYSLLANFALCHHHHGLTKLLILLCSDRIWLTPGYGGGRWEFIFFYTVRRIDMHVHSFQYPSSAAIEVASSNKSSSSSTTTCPAAGWLLVQSTSKKINDCQ